METRETIAGKTAVPPLKPDSSTHLRCRDVYLRIEQLPAYSPVAPDEGEHGRYKRDCMRHHGHEDATIPEAEVERRRLDAVVFREYVDPGYTVPNMAKFVEHDITEPPWDRRIPGCVLYAEPNERLHVHVRNDDTEPHSFHVHGLIYGIDSDGSWPMGVAADDGTRSDAICPGETWRYVFDITNETVGCWPFHDHVMDIQAVVDKGLFGGIVVRHPRGPKPDLEVPFFLHRLVGSGGEPTFDSGGMNGGDSFSPHVRRCGHLRIRLSLSPDAGHRACESNRPGERERIDRRQPDTPIHSG